MPPKTAKPAGTPFRVFQDQARQEFGAELAKVTLTPPPRRSDNERTSDYAHARSASARKHEALAGVHLSQNRHVDAVREFGAAAASLQAEFSTKVLDQKQHPRGTEAYKKHEAYIADLSSREQATVQRRKNIKEAWQKTRANQLRDAEE